MTVPLRKNIDGPNSKYLVFTSAGENAKLHHWLKGSRNFDLWICNYGNENNKYKILSDYYIERKGGKFPNLHYAYQHWQSILNHYKAIFVVDDDIIINGSDISRLFEILDQYDLWLLQPAYNPIGKLSHPITNINPYTFLRYTNFVEVGCPLFRQDKLDTFMKIYDPVLVGYGVDYWFMNVLGPKINGKVAVVDAVPCINPRDFFKGGYRDIDLLQDKPTRIKNWKIIKEQYNINVLEHIELGAIKNTLSISVVLRAIKTYSIMGAFKLLGKLKRLAGILKRLLIFHRA